MTDIIREIDEHQRAFDALRLLGAEVERAADGLAESIRSGGKVLWFGNGGSAAQAQHFAAELVGRYERDRPGLASVALTTDTSVLTAVANDYSYDGVFARQVSALAHAGDTVVALSTSGNSPSVVEGLRAARALGARTVGLLGGDGGAARALCDVAIVVPAQRASTVQEAHLFLGHQLCARRGGGVGDRR